MAKKREPQPGEAVTLKLTKYAQFTPGSVPRSDIQAAPYNPRRITEEARRKLRKNLERVGLLEPIIWNKRTGNVVGGHQRLKALDALEGSPDYLVPVAVVDLSESEERAQNVFLNNGEAQGTWDLPLLADLFLTLPDPDLTGFDSADRFTYFGLDAANPAPVAVERSKAVEALQPDDDDPAPAQPTTTVPTGRPQNFDRREEQQADRADAAFYLVVTFPNVAACEAFTEKHGLPSVAVTKYVDGGRLDRMLSGETGV